ncbi:MAG: class SAM-dependent methyltransferase [Chthonomonadales bacterium]|nr:class SAM-dependent methyltransferase [Chthonomonadales bacterium]
MTAKADVPAYDAVAEWYDSGLRTGSPIHALALPAMQALCGDLTGQRVCDLACGQGILTRELAQAGASVVGIDLSPALLALARGYEADRPLGIVYEQGDAQMLSDISDAAFDGVTCCLALMDIPDLAACLRTAARILRPDGWFVFAVTHPCFQTPEGRWTGQKGGTVRREVRGYFREIFWRSDNRNGVRGQVGAYHRTLATYLNGCIEAGLSLERLAEPQALDETAQRVPGYAEVPAALVVSCRKRVE